MALVLIISIAVVACLAGWIAHIIEKWLRPQSISREKIKRSPSPLRTTTVRRSKSCLRFSEIESPVSIEQIESPHALRSQQPSITSFQTTGIEARFEQWLGEGANKYPPDWKYRSAEVRQRDGDRCRVSGCPSIGSKHVHHLRAISNGGSHALSNLITLCEFHHALMPDHLEAIGENIKSDRFGVRRGHTRRNQAQPGFHFVKPAITRYKLANSLAIQEMISFQQCLCLACNADTFECEPRQMKGWPVLDKAGKAVSFEWRLICQNCGMVLYLPQGLNEELGLVLAHGFRQITVSQLTVYEQDWLRDLPFMEAKPCPRHDCLGHLIPKENRRDHSIFQGCSMWDQTGCRGRI